jgi:hypothetical protein
LIEGTDFKVYINKLVANLKPITLAKISDLTANLKPVDNNILNKACNKPHQTSIEQLKVGSDLNAEADLTKLNRKVSDLYNELKDISNKSDAEVFDFLDENCRHFEEKELVEILLNRVIGVWRVCLRLQTL